jgi:hypothetical protein
VHLSGFAAVVSVHITILSAPVKHASLTEAVPSLSVALPVQGAPEDIEKPPIGPQEFIVVGGTGGCGATCKHPVAIKPAIATLATINLESAQILTSANLGTIPRIRPPPSVCFMMNDPIRPSLSFYPLATIVSRLLRHIGIRNKSRVGDHTSSGLRVRSPRTAGIRSEA